MWFDLVATAVIGGALVKALIIQFCQREDQFPALVDKGLILALIVGTTLTDLYDLLGYSPTFWSEVPIFVSTVAMIQLILSKDVSNQDGGPS